MSRQSQLSPDNILRFLQLRSGPASIEDLSRSLQVKKSSRRALLQMLAKLKKRGLVEELSHGRFLLRQSSRPPQSSAKPQSAAQPPAENFPQHKAVSRDEIKGRLVLHQDGYGFVVPDVAIPNLDGDLFIPRDFVEDAMHGDHVIAKVSRLSGAPGARRAEGRILRIVSRAHPSVVGLFRYSSRGCVVVPYDPRVQHEIELPAGEELSPALREQLLPSEKERPGKRPRLAHIPKLDGAVVNAELVRYARDGASPIGRVIEILGRPGDLGVDTEIIIRKHHLPHTFPGEVAHEAEQLARPVSESELSGREDFRSLPIVTIDGETARDFVEDAMHGDHVIAKITRLSGAPGARRAEGRILRVVSRAHPSVVGLFRYTSRGCVVVPYDPRVQHEIELPPGEELSPTLREQLLPGEKERPGKRLRLAHIAKLDGAVVNAELIRYAREGASP
ncbi:MAG TPA: hypothetical protein VK728_20105, partial [Candidatus Sulfotelmatobacter sp.]|nr:hypothetical protein [Candidatus Sulfotelmatobacter sp.]